MKKRSGSYSPHPRYDGYQGGPICPGREAHSRQGPDTTTASSSPAQDDATQAGGGEYRAGEGTLLSLHPPSWDGAGMPKSRSATGLASGVPLGRIGCPEIHTHTSTACKFPAKDEDITNCEPWFHTCDLLNLPHNPARWPLFSYFIDERSEAYQQGYVLISPTPYI